MRVKSRFSYFRDKFQVFILGLLFGLVLGGGFFVLKLDSYVKELSFYKSLTQKEDKSQEITTDEKQADEKPVVKKAKKESSKDESIVPATTNEHLAGDTVVSAIYNSNGNTGEIVVRKDEQMASKNYVIISVDAKKSDSTAVKELNSGSLSVEFWKSPLNYHGYKYIRNKLVLFGYGDQDLISVIKIDNSTFIKCLTGVFRIEPTTEFHQLERITDENTLSKIQ